MFFMWLSTGTLILGFLLVITVVHISIVPAIGDRDYHRAKCIITNISMSKIPDMVNVSHLEVPNYTAEKAEQPETADHVKGVRYSVEGVDVTGDWFGHGTSNVNRLCPVVEVTFIGNSPEEVKRGQMYFGRDTTKADNDMVSKPFILSLPVHDRLTIFYVEHNNNAIFLS